MSGLPPSFLRAPIAHRALHDRAAGRPENSLEAIRAAVAAGYGIELDIQPSADGVPMVVHDYDLKRLTGETGPVRGRSARELQGLRLLGGETGIPTLADVLADVAGRVPLLVEIKDQDGAMGRDVGPLERAVARVLAGYDGDVAVMSFNPHAIAELAEAAPDIPRGLTTCAYEAFRWPGLHGPVRDVLRSIPDYDRVGACFVSHRWSDLARPRVRDLRDAGAAILCWTVKNAGDERIARAVAHNITFEGYAAAHPA
ncbi:glycerophosphodiester phosphodiesterase family protein [Rhodovulum adriaticum]|uniref:Glycerophosphoryl diester phosphodiesterase n=1 Tax=Rhodovulum adriaticum TaxID=35804 RepID=A0A4R2NYS5_RHOAD|nr:glycerophosphodiester phosphodiesterase family protein [Rhodovulum adriaticum]MBK1634919.1 phosphodiesterase [Rhodovulum adriaticum]TCP27390.1 glycerophosphoryl diester phosphodiesterase [Rhodovulum adriaticum]